ncbi:MAG: hypothetical protein ABWW69_00940 [Pyrodictiaceae archaeon]
MSSRSSMQAVAFALIGLGVALLLIVAYYAVYSFNNYTVEVESGGNSIVEALTSSASVLIDLLVRVAFLGLALAAGSTLLSRGVDLLKSAGGGGRA